MSKRFNALGGQESSDVKFMTEIIAQICDYAVDNGLNPTDTVNIIASCCVWWHKEEAMELIKKEQTE